MSILPLGADIYTRGGVFCTTANPIGLVFSKELVKREKGISAEGLVRPVSHSQTKHSEPHKNGLLSEIISFTAAEGGACPSRDGGCLWRRITPRCRPHNNAVRLLRAAMGSTVLAPMDDVDRIIGTVDGGL